MKNAVICVYESVDRESARAYREDHEVGEEFMGILVHQYIETGVERHMFSGYANSMVYGVPELMEARLSTYPGMFWREKLERYRALDSMRFESVLDEVQYYPLDQQRMSGVNPYRVAQLVSILEDLWGYPIQIEW